MKRKIGLILSGFFFLLCSFIIVFESLQSGGESSLKSGFFASLFDFGNKNAQIIEPERLEISFEEELNIRSVGVISYTIYPETSTDKRVSFESSNPSIITIDEEGNIHPNKLGVL